MSNICGGLRKKLKKELIGEHKEAAAKLDLGDREMAEIRGMVLRERLEELLRRVGKNRRGCCRREKVGALEARGGGGHEKGNGGQQPVAGRESYNGKPA
jgi:hypothetical protein